MPQNLNLELLCPLTPKLFIIVLCKNYEWKKWERRRDLNIEIANLI